MLFIQEIIQIGVINVVKTMKSIDIPSTPNLNLMKLFIKIFLLQIEIQMSQNLMNTIKIMRARK